MQTTSSGCLTLFGIPFAIVGIVLAFSAFHSPDTQQLVLHVTMSLLFCSGGFGLMIFGVVSKRSAAKAKALVDRNPDKPWLWREDWAQGYALPEWKQTSTTYTVIGITFLLFSVPMMLNLVPELLIKHRYETLIALLFPLCGIYLLGLSYVAYLRGRKFRDLRFVPSGVPAAIGGRLQGKVQAAFALPAGHSADLVLSCVRSYVSGSGKNESRWDTVLWQDRKTAEFYSDGQQCFVPVDVNIPYDTKETDTKNPNDEIIWRLAANSKLPGLDFRVSFLVPVFKTTASNPNQTIATLETQTGTMPRNSEIAVSVAPDGGVRFYFAAARNKKIAAMLTVFGAIFTGAGVFFGYASAQSFTWFVGAIPLTVSGGVGLLLLAFAFWLWFGSSTIEIVRRELHVRSGCFGLSHSRVALAADIRDLELYSGMQQGNDVWYDLKVRLKNGRSFTAGSAMLKPEAEWFRAELKKDLGLPG